MSTYTEQADEYLKEESENFLLIEEMTLGVLVDISKHLEKISSLVERTSLSQQALDVAS
jgi:hypothetical protein